MTSPNSCRSSRRSRRSAESSEDRGAGPVCCLRTAATTQRPHRQALRSKRIRPLIARRMTAHGSGLGSQRWVVERTLSWLRQYRRLRVRYERTAETHEAFVRLACSLICRRTLRGSFLRAAARAQSTQSTGIRSSTVTRRSSVMPFRSAPRRCVTPCPRTFAWRLRPRSGCWPPCSPASRSGERPS